MQPLVINVTVHVKAFIRLLSLKQIDRYRGWVEASQSIIHTGVVDIILLW